MIRPRHLKEEAARPAARGRRATPVDPEPAAEVSHVARQRFPVEAGGAALLEGRHRIFPLSAGRPGEVGSAGACARAGGSLQPRHGVPQSARGVVGARAASPEELSVLRDLEAMLEKEMQTFEAASFDALTGLTNRSGLAALGEEMLALSRTADDGAAVLLLDLDGLTQINQRLGREEGDRALHELARLLEATFRASDLIARVGDDEFCVVLTPYTDEAETFAVVDRLRRAVDAFNESARVTWSLAIDVGCARHRPEMSFESLVDLAHARMVEARALRRSTGG